MASTGSRRLQSFGEEVTALKLQRLQDQREISMLREENRCLKTTVASHEAVLTLADRARVEAETCVLLNNAERSKASDQPTSNWFEIDRIMPSLIPSEISALPAIPVHGDTCHI